MVEILSIPWEWDNCMFSHKLFVYIMIFFLIQPSKHTIGVSLTSQNNHSFPPCMIQICPFLVFGRSTCFLSCYLVKAAARFNSVWDTWFLHFNCCTLEYKILQSGSISPFYSYLTRKITHKVCI